MAQLPVLPHGSPSLLSSLSETFAFHASPESFIASRVIAFHSKHPDLADSRTPIRAKVLNRNVAVISSYEHVKQLLCDGETSSKLSAAKAYDELMSAFFQPPNLLLSDSPNHEPMKEAWKAKMAVLPAQSRTITNRSIRSFFGGLHTGTTIDLYDRMKTLSWHLILDIFLPELRLSSPVDVVEIMQLQEDLLRGQFSLIPVSINTRLWQSPRSKGLKASQKLHSMFQERIKKDPQGCPFTSNAKTDPPGERKLQPHSSPPATNDDVEKNEHIANHLLLFTSSLAVKAMASLLTAILLNLYVHRPTNAQIDGAEGLATRIRNITEPVLRFQLIDSLVRETERLSPPVVGIMRRTTADIVLHSQSSEVPPTLVPAEWDTWLYFVGAGRDPATFGPTAETFMPDRWLDLEVESAQGLAFGAGPKTCLGQDVIRMVVRTAVEICVGAGTNVDGSSNASVEMVLKDGDLPTGVKGWLGWEQDVKPEEWAKNMKQLPTQRPIKPIMVEVKHNFGSA